MTPVTPHLRRWWHGLDRLQHTIVKLVAYGACMTVMVLSRVVGFVAYSVATTNTAELHGSCDFLRSVASAPITPQTSALGLSIVSGAKHWFEVQHCPGAID